MHPHMATLRLTVACIFQLYFTPESSLAALPTAHTNVLRIDLGIVKERIIQ
jgi:hypothetical protein